MTDYRFPVAILSNDGVLVFDTNGTPAAAAAVLAQVRTLTDRPVRYVVNSHWHWDHWYGTETYQQAFPDLQIVALEKRNADLAASSSALQKQIKALHDPEYLVPFIHEQLGLTKPHEVFIVVQTPPPSLR